VRLWVERGDDFILEEDGNSGTVEVLRPEKITL